MQTHRDWNALVIGDQCGPETEAAIRSVLDPRIRYYNLPRRFGEQSGPNSAGLHLAGGDFVSFLNQDDLLLKDHLAQALERLEACRGDLYFGKFANATGLELTSDGDAVPAFSQILPANGDLRQLMLKDHVFDPSSFWVVRTSFARKVGPWHPGVRLRRMPICDWLLRAWRLGGEFCLGDTVTGIRMWTHNLRREGAPDVPSYFGATPENACMLERLQNEHPDDTRSFIERQLQRSRAERHSRSHTSLRRLASKPFRWAYRKTVRQVRLRLFSSLYRRFGIDPISILRSLSAHPEGMALDALTHRRIGEALPRDPTIEEFLAAPEACRVL